MRIVYFNPVGHLGGAENSLLDLVASVRAAEPSADLRIVVATEGPLLEAAKMMDTEVVLLPMPQSLLEVGDGALKDQGRLAAAASLAWRLASVWPAGTAYVRRLRRVFENLDPDLIHTNGIKCHLLASFARVEGVPIVWHIRDFLGSRRMVTRALRWASKRAASGIAISETVGRDARKVLPGLPIEVIYNAIDTDRFSPGPGDGRLLDDLAEMKPPEDGTIRVGLVATYAVWKGHDVFIEAAAKVMAASSSPAVRFYIVGGPIYRTHGSQVSEGALRGRAAALGIDHALGFAGFQIDTAKIYRALDIAVHASKEPEPFGRTIVEAMACGRPVIVSRAGGAAELFTHDHDAVGFTPNDPDALAQAILSLAGDADRRQRLGAQARLTAIERFSRPRLGREVAALYARLLASSGPRGRAGG